jgi:hypothetical protein
MDAGTKPGLAEQIAGALDWWRDAGVDGDWQDEAKGWLAEVSPDRVAETAPAAKIAVRQAEPPPPPEPAIMADAIPQDLAAYSQWWLTEPALDNGRTAGRVAPRGPIGAPVMVLVGEPEREDEAAGRLLSGQQGRLLDAILAAIGIAPESAYVASALPRHTPLADWAAAANDGLGTAALRHIELAAPGRLIVFGSTILPLLGHDPAKSPAFLLKINQGSANLPVLAAKDLAALVEKPRWKASFWRSWLEWGASLETNSA